MDWFRTLTIFNSVALAFFLLVSIIAMIKVIKVMNKIDAMTQKAQNIADNADQFVSSIKNSLSLAFITKMANSFFRSARGKNKKS